MSGHVGTPLALPACAGTRYHYGTGPFQADAPNGPDAVDDAYVFNLGCDKGYSISRGGRCVTINFGTQTSMQASAWTYFGDPATVRSFLRFDLSGLSVPTDALTVATLTLTPYVEAQSTLSGSNDFALHTVAGVGPSGSGSRSFDVTAPVQAWLGGATNNGFRLALQTEAHYRHQSFGTADGPAPLVLTMTFETPGYVTGPVATFGDAEAGEGFIVTYRGAPPSTIVAAQRAVDGELRDGFVHTFVSGVDCGRERLKVFAFVALTARIRFVRQDDSFIPIGERGEVIVRTETADGGIAWWTLALVVAAPDAVRLHAAAPNPAAGTSRIAFDLPAAGVADLRVYDTLGREVAVLADGADLGPGTHERWWAGDVAAGVYVYRLSFEGPGGSETATGRLTVVR